MLASHGRQTEGAHRALIDGVVLEGIGNGEELWGEQFGRDDQFTGFPERGANRHPQLIGRCEQLGDLAAGVGPRRPDPGINRHLSRSDGLRQLDQLVVVKHGAGRVDLKDQPTAAVALGPSDRLVDEVGNDPVEETRD